MAVLSCKMCGGELVLTPGEKTARCAYCDTLQTIPEADNEKKLTLFSRANRLRMNCEFDKAAGIYENLAAEFPQEAEAYWGLVLCKFGIEYVDDPATGKKIPTCHRSSFDSVMEDEDLEQALENADAVSRRLYREEAKQIEELRKGILEVSGKEAPYDIFICYKETDENGQRTLDSVLAQDIYDALTDKGYRVFFSRITLEDKLGQEYEPYIFAALNSAKIMLAVGTDYEYYNAVWVKNEWSRYLKLMAKDKEKYLIPCYKNLDAYDMPKEFAKLQAQDLGKLGAMQDLTRGVEKLLGGTRSTASAEAAVNAAVSPLEVMLKRGFMALEDNDWKLADGFFEEALNQNPECGRAYMGKFLALQRKTSFEEFTKGYREGLEANVILEERNHQFAGQEDCRQYVVPGFLSESELLNLYPRGTSFRNAENYWQSCREQWETYLAEDKLLIKVFRYADPEVSQLLKVCSKTVTDFIAQKIQQSCDEEAQLFRELDEQFAAQQSEIELRITSMYEKACQSRHAVYLQQCAIMNAPGGPKNWAIPNLRREFMDLGDYLDSRERYQKCCEMQRKIENESKNRQNMVRQWVATGRCASCGGAFKGLLNKRCSQCGKEKGY